MKKIIKYRKQRWLVLGGTLSCLIAGCYGSIHIVSRKQQEVNPETLARGQVVYEEHCVRCHGPEGRGDGPEATGLGVPIPNLLEYKLHVVQHGPEQIIDYPHYSVDAISRQAQHGGSTMPGFKTAFTESELKDLTQYLVRLQQTAEPVSR
ncbi:MAG: c-type cytochrome [SAR324 cluster bacterium]|nr:c-type cytochrome [SAR324 cluster bacterium]